MGKITKQIKSDITGNLYVIKGRVGGSERAVSLSLVKHKESTGNLKGRERSRSVFSVFIKSLCGGGGRKWRRGRRQIPGAWSVASLMGTSCGAKPHYPDDKELWRGDCFAGWGAMNPGASSLLFPFISHKKEPRSGLYAPWGRLTSFHGSSASKRAPFPIAGETSNCRTTAKLFALNGSLGVEVTCASGKKPKDDKKNIFFFFNLSKNTNKKLTNKNTHRKVDERRTLPKGSANILANKKLPSTVNTLQSLTFSTSASCLCCIISFSSWCLASRSLNFTSVWKKHRGEKKSTVSRRFQRAISISNQTVQVEKNHRRKENAGCGECVWNVWWVEGIGCQTVRRDEPR